MSVKNKKKHTPKNQVKSERSKMLCKKRHFFAHFDQTIQTVEKIAEKIGKCFCQTEFC